MASQGVKLGSSICEIPSSTLGQDIRYMGYVFSWFFEAPTKDSNA
jgi:hypothetical protein